MTTKPEDTCDTYPAHFPSYKLSVITRKKNQIKTLLESESHIDMENMVYRRDEYYDKCESLHGAIEVQLQNPNISSKEKVKLTEWRDANTEDTQFRLTLDEWLKSHEMEEEATKGTSQIVDVNDSVSQVSCDRRSNVSNRSNSSSVRLQLKERKARLQADMQFTDEIEKLQEQKAAVDKKLKTLVHKRELRDIEYLEVQLEDHGAPSRVSCKPNTNVSKKSLSYSKYYENEPKVLKDKNVPKISEFSAMLSKQNEISMLLAQNQEKIFLPRHEPIIFDGLDPLQYKDFMLSFDKTIVSRCDCDSDKFYFLLKYTSGAPNELVKSCNGSDLTKSYAVAMQLLKKKYGNEYKIAECIYRKLEEWPQVRNEDAKALNELSLFLTGSTNRMNEIDPLNQLNSPKVIMSVVQKLPFDLRKRWRQKAYYYQEAGHVIGFKDFSKFVGVEAAVLDTPMYSCIQDNKDFKIKKSFPENKQKCFTTSLMNSSENKKNCICCKKTNHDISHCIFFNKKSYTEKIEFIKKNRACFACLKVSNHTSKYCKNRLECSHCGKKHPSCLHRTEYTDYNSNESHKEPNEDGRGVSVGTKETPNEELRINSEAKIFSVGVGKNNSLIGTGHDSRVICPAVPVKIRTNKRSQFIETYMAIDPWATGCFIDEALLQKLGDKGKPIDIRLTTMHSVQVKISSNVLEDLEVSSLDGTEVAILHRIYARKSWPFTIEDSPRQADLNNYPEFNEIPFQFLPGEKIGILVGMQETAINKPLEVISSNHENGPYATLYRFGWVFSGSIGPQNISKKFSCHVIKSEVNTTIEDDIQKIYSQDFLGCESENIGPSREDLHWERKVKKSLKQRADGHYEVCLPFRDDNVIFPNNYSQAFRRLHSLRKRLVNDETFYKDYSEFMNTTLERSFAERVPDKELFKEAGKLFFICHHGVYHKVKRKIRVVFDCSAKFGGISLNDRLMQGPDLTNSLLGILLRFRQEKIAFMCDIEKMFYMVKVNKDDADFMRFLWYPGGNLDMEPVQYRLLVHVFGAVSSPSCSNFVLRHTAAEEGIDPQVKETILRGFYVDDCMKSVNTEENAIGLLHKVRDQVCSAKFNLTGVISNSRSVLDSICSEDLSKNVRNLNLISDVLPQERALGVSWNVERDSLGFALKLETTSPTRRGLLSAVGSFYDPLGIAGPILIPARRIFQETCRLKLAWNDCLPDDLLERWKRWQIDLCFLNKYEVPRCLKRGMENIKKTQLHIFCDGSKTAYGCAAYLRYVDDQGLIVCSLIMAKSRLTPLNNSTLCTVPRIELNAAVLSIKVKQILHRELDIQFDTEHFWSDSATVLKYINSETGRFQRFVSNRVAYIRSNSEPQQWHYVPTECNPADLVSRGCTVARFNENEEWKTGPKFLYETENYWPCDNVIEEITDQDLEIIKGCKILVVNIKGQDSIDKILNSTSDFYKLKCHIAWFLRFRMSLRTKIWIGTDLSVTELKIAEFEIWRLVQEKEFANEKKLLLHKNCNENRRNALRKCSPLSKLNPFIDMNGIMRVGGRLSRASIAFESKHQIVLPSNSHAVRVLVRELHKTIGHLGRESLLTLIRQKYWIVGGNALVRRILKDCVLCRRNHERPSQQIMADLPEDRVVSNVTPFSRTGVDYFGPIVIIRGRTTEKRYGVIFTCLSSRAVHLEIAHSLDTSSFICALRRFTSRRGNISRLRSDNGTNFVGAQRELREAIAGWNKKHIEQWMKQNDIDWSFNPPLAPHFGGIWEREIKTIKQVLNSMIREQNIKLKDEALHTLMCEVEFILNNRPLTAISPDPDDYQPLTPNHLLLLQSDTPFPPGLFAEEDLYVRQRWRQVQYLVNLFWSRWRREYLTMLQKRQKWMYEKVSHQVGDLVLIVDQMLPRGQWSMGRITNVLKDSKGHVRIAKVKVAKKGSNGILGMTTVEFERPIAKLIMLKSFKN